MFSSFTPTTWRLHSRRMWLGHLYIDNIHPSIISSSFITHHRSTFRFPLRGIKKKAEDGGGEEERKKKKGKAEESRRGELKRALDQLVAMALRAAVAVLLAVIWTAGLSLSAPPPIFSSISASPASLPSFPPAISPAPELAPPSLSPDITPELPTPGAGSDGVGSPSSNEVPTIPSTLSPPNPDAVASPELDLASSPASSPAKMSSSAVRLIGPTSLPLLVFCFFIALLLHLKLV